MRHAIESLKESQQRDSKSSFSSLGIGVERNISKLVSQIEEAYLTGSPSSDEMLAKPPSPIVEETIIEANFEDEDPGNYSVKKIVKKKIKKRRQKSRLRQEKNESLSLKKPMDSEDKRMGDNIAV